MYKNEGMRLYSYELATNSQKRKTVTNWLCCDVPFVQSESFFLLECNFWTSAIMRYFIVTIYCNNPNWNYCWVCQGSEFLSFNFRFSKDNSKQRCLPVHWPPGPVWQLCQLLQPNRGWQTWATFLLNKDQTQDITNHLSLLPMP